ncbi:MAG: glycerol-3-phosphate 1-O-acyltransferase PlsY [Chthoniobacterales bacterium]
MNFFYLLYFAAAYFLGSIPFGLIAGRMKGVDLRKHGSGNIGATNAGRVLGKPLGYTVFALDFLKGLLAVGLPGILQAPEWVGIVCFFCVVLGHNFPLWLGFRGGKGIATSGGGMLGLIPLAFVISLSVWLILFFATRYVSLASIGGSLALPATTGALYAMGKGSGLLFAVTAIMCVMAVWLHRSNIKRLLAGTESRASKKTSPKSS